MNKRLDMLEKLTASPQADSFAFYCLALEYRKERRVAEAIHAFEALRARDAHYLPMYLMAGQMLREAERGSEALGWLEQGSELARRKGDAKTLGELEAEIAQVRG